MKIQNIFILLLIAGVQSLSAHNTPDSPFAPKLLIGEEFSCTLPAPSNIFVVSVNPDSVMVAWTPVPGAAQYRLSAHDASNGNLLGAPIMVGGGQITATLSVAGSSGMAFVRIHSVCASGEWNPLAFRDTPDFGIPVIDLVATGFTYPETNRVQEVGYNINNGANIKWNTDFDFFEVRYEGRNTVWVRRFALNVPGGPSSDLVEVKIGAINGEEGNSGQRIVFLEHIENGTKVGMYIKFREDPNTPLNQAPIVAELKPHKASSNGTGGVLFKTTEFQDSRCSVERQYFMGGTLKMKLPTNVVESESILLKDRSNPGASTPHLSARPNPFNDAITVTLPASKSENTRTLLLYDLLGALHMTCQVPANQTECTLNTSLLNPGVYFLRIETDGKMETIKLLKTE